jgi:hypothetical protein
MTASFSSTATATVMDSDVIFVNKDGKVVYVPRYRRYFHEYHSSKLVMNVRDEEK